MSRADSRSDLMALADRYEQGTRKAVESGYYEFGPEFQREREMIVSALRLAASQPDREVLKSSVERQSDGGLWRSCSGCFETVDGYSSAPVDEIFGCQLGCGCRECGGIGAVWDNTDYDDMVSFMVAEDEADERNERIRKALEFYANPFNWIDTPSWDGDPSCMTPKAIPVKPDEGRPCDCGDTAREALLSKTLTEGEKKRPQIEASPANEGSSLSPDGGAV